MSDIAPINSLQADFNGTTQDSEQSTDDELPLRLDGGQDKDDIDNIDDDDEVDEEPAPRPKKKLRIADSEPETEDQPPPLSTKEKIKHYTKLAFFVAIWLLTLIFFALMPVKRLNGVLTSIQPGSEQDLVLDSSFENGDIMRLNVHGPFAIGTHENDVPSKNGVDLIAVMHRVIIDKNSNEEKFEEVSNKLYFEMIADQDFNTAPIISRHGLFQIKVSDEFESGTTHLRFSVAGDQGVTIKIFSAHAKDYQLGIILGALVLLFLYVSIIWELVNRTLVSMIAATLALSILSFLSNRPMISQIVSWIDVETLMLLFGMMLLVSILSDSGIFDYFAVQAYRMSKGHVWPLINSLCFSTAFLSAFLDSVTMMLLIAPVIIKLCEVMEADPVLVLMFLAIYANVGAACTPVGDPPNIIITTNAFIEAHDVNFLSFMLHCVPCVLLAILQTHIQLRYTFRSLGRVPYEESEEEKARRVQKTWQNAAVGLGPYTRDSVRLRKMLMRRAKRIKKGFLKLGRKRQPTDLYAETLAELQSTHGIRNKPLLIKSTIAFSFSIVLFFLHSVHDLHQLSLGWAALLGAVLLMVIADFRDIMSLMRRVEWSTLIFFATLFILMEVLTEIGLIVELGHLVEHMVGLVDEEKRLLVAILLVLWVSAIASAFLDNIPVTTMMLRIVISMGQNRQLKLPLHPLIWALALGACFGGNGTLIGASANVVSAGVAEQHGYPFTFKRFFYVGFPVMIGNTIVTTIYLLFCHVLFSWHDPPISS